MRIRVPGDTPTSVHRLPGDTPKSEKYSFQLCGNTSLEILMLTAQMYLSVFSFSCHSLSITKWPIEFIHLSVYLNNYWWYSLFTIKLLIEFIHPPNWSTLHNSVLNILSHFPVQHAWSTQYLIEFIHLHPTTFNMYIVGELHNCLLVIIIYIRQHHDGDWSSITCLCIHGCISSPK